jgi:hypothetical protein
MNRITKFRNALATGAIAAAVFATISVAAPHLAHAGYVICNAFGYCQYIVTCNAFGCG